MDKIPFLRLWDTYRGLLTPTQQEITDMYFNLDLTPSEIADEKGITRQGVYECLKTCEKQLEEYESKLHFSAVVEEMCLETSFRLTDIGRWTDSFKSAHPHFEKEFKELEEIINKDYSGEVGKVLKDPKMREILDTDFIFKR